VTTFIESLRAAARIRIFLISEAIENLPLEIREKIYKEFIAIKLKERKEMGWNEVLFEIEEAPFCEERSRITRSCFAIIARFVIKTDAVMSVFKKGNTTISVTPYMTRTNTTKSFRKFTERR